MIDITHIAQKVKPLRFVLKQNEFVCEIIKSNFIVYLISQLSCYFVNQIFYLNNVLG